MYYRRSLMLIVWLGLPLGLHFGSDCSAQELEQQHTQVSTVPSPASAARFSDWPTQLKINGSIILAASIDDVLAAEPSLLKLRDEDNRLPLDSSADDRVQQVPTEGAIAPMELAVLQLGDSVDATGMSVEQCQQRLSQAAGRRIPLVTAEELVDGSAVAAVLVWAAGEAQVIESDSAAAQALRSQVRRGGTLLLIGAATQMASVAWQQTQQPHIQPGLDLVLDCIVLTDYAAERDAEKLRSLVAAQPRSVGVGISSGTAMVLIGRKAIAAGAGQVTFLLPALGPEYPNAEATAFRVQDGLTTHTIKPSMSRRDDPEQWLLDVTQWRRMAIERTLAAFPPAEPTTPAVANGSLMIVGGGGLPEGLMQRFVESAGGAGHAKLVYVPCEESDQVPERQSMLRTWNRMGVVQASMLHTKDRRRADEDQEFLQPLKEATGIWFGGGRQWNFADSYYGTTAHELMHQVLARGGVIGGSSAGASIQGDYLARATPIQNFRIMAPGYERGGLGFLPGVAIDQHFTQRGRQKDMTQLVNRYPQLLGIGIDETTAIIVQQSTAEVIGDGDVYFYDRRQAVVDGQPDFLRLPAGQTYDFTP